MVPGLTRGRLESVNLAVVRYSPETTDAGYTGIDKRPVRGPVQTGADVLVGDTISDLRHHGGRNQAVYAYAREDAAWWATELDRDVTPGMFGENLSTVGVDVTHAVIGERWAIGTAEFEVCSVRIPCRTFAGFWDVPDLIKRFTAAQRSGAYLRIWSPGAIEAGDTIEIVHRPDHGVTVDEVFRALTGDHSLAYRLLEAPELEEEAHRRARVWLAGSSAEA